MDIQLNINLRKFLRLMQCSCSLGVFRLPFVVGVLQSAFFLSGFDVSLGILLTAVYGTSKRGIIKRYTQYNSCKITHFTNSIPFTGALFVLLSDFLFTGRSLSSSVSDLISSWTTSVLLLSLIVVTGLSIITSLLRWDKISKVKNGIIF